MRRQLALLLALVAFSQTALADESSAEMVERGIRLRREHRDAEALHEFRRADQLNPAPRIRAQIGLAEQALAQWADAERDLKQALAAKDDPWIVGHADALAKALVSIGQHLGTVMVESNASGAELWINGARSGGLPMLPARVAAGIVQLEVRAPGYEPAQRSVELAPGQKVEQKIELAPAPPAPAETKMVLVPSAPGTTEAPASLPLQRTIAWGTLGGAVALLAGAGAAQIVEAKNAKSFNDDGLCADTATQTRAERCPNYKAQAETAQTFANLGYIGAGALGIASAILFVTSSHSDKPKTDAPKTSSSLWIGMPPGGFAIGWRGSL